jgi:2',3'-cyclic-nucleotide 2'-phosphodiesterase (5'-nucleotidase family)
MKKSILIFILVAQIVFIQLTFAQEKKLNVLYTNDLHAHFEPHIVPWVSKTRKVGGFVNIATLVKREKKANKNTVYLDAGDSFSGPYHSFLTKGEAVIDAMNFWVWMLRALEITNLTMVGKMP